MAVVKVIRLDNCIVRIHDDCFEDEESVQRRLQAIKRSIMQSYIDHELLKTQNINPPPELDD